MNLLIWPDRILANLERVRAAGVVDDTPNAWQLSLGVLRLWHRVLFHGDTVGRSPGGRVRPTLRARALAHKPIRLPFLLVERAVAPLDFTGLANGPERLIRHLLGAHHDGPQFIYDLEILSAHPGALAELRRAVADLVAHDTPRHRWLRDLTVFEGYHEALLAAVDDALAHGVRVPPEAAHDPDLSFAAYLRWCARQPATPSATWHAWRAGRFALDAKESAA